MKAFRYEKGHIEAVTMTVSELREKLNEFPQDMPVFGVWEGVCGEIRQDGFKVERYGSHHEDACECLMVDVDQRHDHPADTFDSTEQLLAWLKK